MHSEWSQSIGTCQSEPILAIHDTPYAADAIDRSDLIDCLRDV